MFGLLYYNSSSTWGTGVEVGQVVNKKKDYTVTPLTDDDRSGNPVTIGYEVNVLSQVLEFTDDFLTESEWYFRLKFPNNSNKYIDLGGPHEYQIDYDGQIVRNDIEYHTVRINFLITRTDYSGYSTPIV